MSGDEIASTDATIDQRIGKRAIGVIVRGDNNSVTIVTNDAKLTLEQLHRNKLHDLPRNDMDLLRADLRATELVGRERDLEELKIWLNEARSISLRCLTGPAGTGKTRLAIELCERASKLEWVAGFAKQDELRRFYATQSFAAWRWQNPTLIVVDNAGAASRILGDWLEALSRRVPAKDLPPLRILLLERDGDSNTWWADLMRPGDLSGPSPGDLASPDKPVRLPGLKILQDRHSLLSEAMRLAAKLHGLQSQPQPPPLGSDAAFDQRLADDTIDNGPLYLVMAGIISVAEGASLAITRSREELARRIAFAEVNRIKQFAVGRGISETFAIQLAACVTLQGGCDLAQAERLIDEERSISGLTVSSMPTEEIAALLADMLSRSVGPPSIDAVRPDLIGEAFLLEEIPRNRSLEKQLALVERAWRRSGDAVRETLVRMREDFWRGESTHASAIWLSHVADKATEEFDSRLTSGELPPDQAVQSIWKIGRTMGHWVHLTGYILPFVDKLSPNALGAFAAQRAVGLLETGNYQLSREFAEWILRRPAFPKWWKPELFNALGRALFHLGRYAQAVEVYRLGIDAGAPNHPLLAQLYTNLGNALLSSGPVNKKQIRAAIGVLKTGVQLADDPRMRVEARTCLSNALMYAGQSSQAESILLEAWSLAQDGERVSNKARMNVMRDLGMLHLQKRETAHGLKELDAAIEYGRAHFGACHPELMDLYGYAFIAFAHALKPIDLMERMLRVLQNVHKNCDMAHPQVRKLLEIARLATRAAVERTGESLQLPSMRALEIVLRDPAMEEIAKFLVS